MSKSNETTNVATTAAAAAPAPKAPAKAKAIKTLVKADDYVEGTVAELVRGDRLRMNGKVVRQPEMSVLAKLGVAEEIGIADRPEGKRGPAARIYRLPLNGTFAVARK